MSFLKYFSYIQDKPVCPQVCQWYFLLASLHCLVQNLKQQMCMLKALTATTASHRKYNQYTPEEKAAMGKHLGQNSPTDVVINAIFDSCTHVKTCFGYMGFRKIKIF